MTQSLTLGGNPISFAGKRKFLNIIPSIDETTLHINPGVSFELDRDVVHGERYGDTGTTYWVNRRN